MDVNDHGIEVRSKAIGMLKAGLTMKIVSEKLEVSLRSVQRRSRRDILGKSMEHCPETDAQKSSLASLKSSFLKLWRKEGSLQGQ